MNIVADENLAFTDYFFSEFGEIKHLPGRTLTQNDLQGAQALLVRSVTKVNATLLDQQSIEFVGSATIGTDHLDTDYLDQNHITWSNAAGCNAQAVAEYVVTALLTLQPELIHAEQNFCLGVIGLGNVGKKLVALAKKLNWHVIGTDPFVKDEGVKQTDLDTVLQKASAISIHVPLTYDGDYPTFHLLDEHQLNLLNPKTILINSARGPVIKEDALIKDIIKNQRSVVLDVFEHEPVISKQLLDLLALATPHIAGYSLEGKARGTQMIYQSFCTKYGFNAHKTFESQLEACPPLLISNNLQQNLPKYLREIYDIKRDDAALRACLKDGFVDQKSFDTLRKNYPLRREWSAYGAQ